MTTLIILTALYWIPTIVAITRKQHNTGPVIVVNLFLGWTFIGWVVALAMAFNTRPETTYVTIKGERE